MPLKLKFKTIQGKQFDLEFDEDTKVRSFRWDVGGCLPCAPRPLTPCHRRRCFLVLQLADVKAKIEETQGAEFPASSLNIIYQGKVGLDIDNQALTPANPANPANTLSARAFLPLVAFNPSCMASTCHADPEG